jgi:hypothetical protein
MLIGIFASKERIRVGELGAKWEPSVSDGGPRRALLHGSVPWFIDGKNPVRIEGPPRPALTWISGFYERRHCPPAQRGAEAPVRRRVVQRWACR